MSDCKARRLHPAIIVLASAFVLGLSGCMPYELRQILDGPQGTPLSISPSTTTVVGGSSAKFTASGGVPPYTLSLASGGGSFDATTGMYVAPAAAGTATIQVTDKTGRTVNASVTIAIYSGALAISPALLSVAVGGSASFAAIGGKPPYAFSMQSSGSGTATIGSTTGAYVAGPNPGTDIVKLTDSASGVATATVTVTAVSSTVDYSVPATSLPGLGTTSSAIPGGASFTLHNGGSGNGLQSVTWQVYLSSDSILGGGDILVASGAVAGLAAGASVPVTVNGAFPAVSPGPWYLIVQVSAADDTTPSNNTSTASPITLNPLNIDYMVPSVANTGATVAGSAMSGTFTIHNQGSGNGFNVVNWDIYASADTVLDATDYILARGTQAQLAAGGTTGTISFSGFWPSVTGTWYILAVVSSVDDINPANNTTASTPVATSGGAAANVDYTVASLSNTGGTIAGDPIGGSFTIHNGGSDPGAHQVFWTAYLSQNATLEIGTDPVIDSGTTTGLAAGSTSGTITFGGTWPPAPGTWYLIVALSSPDDAVPGNNTSVSGSVATTAPNVDYTVQSVGSTGGTTAGAPLAGSLTIRNAGTHAGSQFIPWLVYLSTDSNLDIGIDQLIAVGSIPAPGLAAGAPSSAIAFAGTWPSSTTSKTWYFIATVGAGDDVNAGNNVVASASVLVTPPNVDYAVTAVNNAGGAAAGGPIAGNFTIHNNGTSPGAATINWTAYVSSDAILDVTDQVIATGSLGALVGGGSSGSIGFAGIWPGTGTWYLIVKVSASDDINPANDYLASSSILVTATVPVYSITSVPLPAGSTTGQAVSGTFTIQNASSNPGASSINWQVYASLGDAVYNAGDILLASGTISALGALGSASPGYAGTWPSTAGTYYIVVRASAADAPVMPDTASGAVVVSNPPPPDYTVSFDPNIPWSGLVNAALSATGTCQITIGNVSANTGHSSVTWAVYLSTDKVLDASDVLLQQGTIGALGGSGSTTVGFAGNWPATSDVVYWLIASVHASDDTNPVNDVVTSVHPMATGDYRYQEGAESNGGVGPAPPAAQTSTTAVTLAANQTMVIEGAMDATGQYDTYKFATLVSMTQLSMQALWATGPGPDMDLYLWDTGTTNLSSIDGAVNSEPGFGTFIVTAVTPRTCYISAYMYSGSVGAKYIILVKGLP